MRADVELRAGDLFVVESDALFGRLIAWAERFKDVDADARYIHAGVILNPAGEVIESEWHVRINTIEEYTGSQIMIGRYAGMNPIGFQAGWDAIRVHIGDRYPVSRLALHLLGLARYIHSGSHFVCSELQAKFTGTACPELKPFLNPFGWDPADLAAVYEYWRNFYIIYQGVW
ncbi:MAG: hypothetical protein ACLQBD_18330 [Syntrophobacteraceae bacterium]